MSDASAVTRAEVASVISDAIAGRILVTLADPSRTWDEVYAGNCEFKFGEWSITFFNDCDCVDYVDCATSPDGRSAEYDDWCKDGETENVETSEGDIERYGQTCPTGFLSISEDDALEALLKAAR